VVVSNTRGCDEQRRDADGQLSADDHEPAGRRTVTAGQTAQSRDGDGTARSATWQRPGPINGDVASYTTPSTTSADNGAQFTVVVSNPRR